MALDNRIVTEVMRQRLGQPDASMSLRFAIGIPEALKATARKVAADPSLRPLMITPRATTTGALVAGAVNLATLYASHRLLLEYLDKGQIFHSSSVFPLRRIPIQAKTFVQQFTEYAYYYVDGDSLFAQSSVPAALAGTLSFAAPSFPATLAQLPESEEIENIFFNKLYEWAISDQAPGNDAAQDGAK